MGYLKGLLTSPRFWVLAAALLSALMVAHTPEDWLKAIGAFCVAVVAVGTIDKHGLNAGTAAVGTLSTSGGDATVNVTRPITSTPVCGPN